MKSSKINYQKIISNLNYWLLLLFIFWLPLKDDYLPLILAFWIFTWLLQGNFKNRLTKFPQKKYYLGFLIYFFLTFIFAFRAEDINYGFFHIQEKLSLIFFPIILFGSSKKIKQNENLILIAFILGNFTASLLCLINAFYTSFHFINGDWFLNHHVWSELKQQSFWEVVNLRYSYFSYTYLSIFKHPAYFSMFITFSIMILIYYYRKGLIVKVFHKIGSISLIIFFIFMIYLLQSRIAFITLGVILVLIPLIELRKRFKKRFIFLSIGLLLVSLVVISKNNLIWKDIQESITLTKNTNEETLNKSDIRFSLWYTSQKIINENFWFGTSPANLTNELVKKYEKLGFQKAANDELNSHNQYLESFAGLGIFGFLSLMFIIIYSFKISLNQRHYLLFFLILILSINFMVESMLNRMAGILFMMFFLSLFVFAKEDN